ncbi:MAG: imelysin family protein [Bacteroidota bacterium]
MKLSNYATKPASGLLFALLFVFVFFACEDDNATDDTVDFDRTALLTAAADNLIIPNLEALQSSVADLSTAVEAFVQNSTEQNLAAARTAWVQTVTDHQHCSAFGFGPGELLLGTYAEVLGAFPINEAGVEENILDADFNLASSFATNIRGFYTVEYLIYGNGPSDAELVAGFDQNRKDYLVLIMDEIQTEIDGIVSEWNSTYRADFIENDGTARGSSVSQYYNEFVKDYENLKNFKLELPAGLTAGQEEVDGTLVEAFYSGISRDLIVEQFENSKNIYFGRSRAGQEFIGFNEYLESVVGGPELVRDTETAVEGIDAAIANLPQGRLSDNVGSNEVEVLRDLLQDNTANFKSSMSSLLGISITFNSGDGD